MPLGFWRLSPQPPWPTLYRPPKGWREYTHTDGSKLCVADGSRKHEFIPPAVGSLSATPGALAAVQALWPTERPEALMGSITYPCIVPSPSLAQALHDPYKAVTAFTTQFLSCRHGRDGHPVHHTWYWAFRRLAKVRGCVVLQEIEDATIDRIYAIPGLEGLGFLEDRAPEAPEWEEALELGDEETAILGNLGAHSTIFPMQADDVLSIRNALGNPGEPSQGK